MLLAFFQIGELGFAFILLFVFDFIIIPIVIYLCRRPKRKKNGKQKDLTDANNRTKIR